MRHNQIDYISNREFVLRDSQGETHGRMEGRACVCQFAKMAALKRRREASAIPEKQSKKSVPASKSSAAVQDAKKA